MLLSMALISVLAKPIIFRGKWQGGVGYGLPSVLYLLLFFLMFFSEYDSIQTAKTSSGKVSQVSVQGPVVAIEPKGVTKSVFQEIPIKEVEKLPIQEISATTVNTNTTVASIDNNNTQYVDANGKGTIIGDTDSKIYHLPEGAYYEKEMQKTSNNVYFKTTAEAEAAGYRASER